MSNYISKFVNRKLNICDGVVEIKNHKLKNPSEAYPFLVDTTVNNIRGMISSVLNHPIKCNNNVDYFKIRESMIQTTINDIVADNKYTNTFELPDNENFYDFSKETYRMVDNGIVPICKLNTNAMLSFFLYDSVKTAVNDSFVVKNNELVVNKDSKFVKDYISYNKEINDNFIKTLTKSINLNEDLIDENDNEDKNEIINTINNQEKENKQSDEDVM